MTLLPSQKRGGLSDFLAVQRALINHTPVPTNNPLGASVAQDLQNQQYQLPNAVYSGQSADAAYLLAAFTPAPFGFYPPNNYGFYANPYALNGGTVLGNYSSSTYHGLQLDATRRLGSGLSLQASYIFSKVLSDSARTTGSATEFYRDANNPRLDRAPAPFDIRNSFKINLSYTTPFRKSSSSALRVLLGDTNLSFVAIAQSGAPFSVLSGWATVASSYSGGASYNTASLAPGASASQAVQFHMTGYGPGVFTSSAQSAFVYPGPGQPGTLQPRMFYGPSIYNIDAAIQRTFRIKETMPLDLRFEAINLTNRVNWSVSDQSAPPPSGLIFLQNGFAGQGASSAFPPRRVQIIARFRF